LPDPDPPAPWEYGPPEEQAEGQPWDPAAEAEVYWERRAEEEAEVHAAIDAEIERLRQINAVRVANGLAPKPRPKRLRIALPNTPGRERKAR